MVPSVKVVFTSSSTAISIFGDARSLMELEANDTRDRVLRVLDFALFCALGQRPAVLNSHESQRGPTGRQTTWPEGLISLNNGGEDMIHAYLSKSDKHVIDMGVKFCWKP